MQPLLIRLQEEAEPGWVLYLTLEKTAHRDLSKASLCP